MNSKRSIIFRKWTPAFSLMEVIISLAIFAIMAVVLLQAVGSVQEAMITTRDLTGREEAKRFVMRRVMSAQNTDAAAAGGTVELSDGESVSWAVSLEVTNLPDLHQATVTLNWSNGDTETLNLWAYRPEWSDASVRSNLIQNMRTEYPQSRLSTF
ncbi:MAG: prepilin-type N-terminal cleavage/methylation domain-containing protein [Puniceicoccales bacterium]|jgi:prepilin-type N-terminal cleavage/methylation domain-containing protein|nr:prepilin-type N-terminal cleavage/methylation domain-containing protein [Puniceicoccales bacterium]